MKGFLGRAVAPLVGLGRAIVSFGLGAPSGGMTYPAVPASIAVVMGSATTIVMSDGPATSIAVVMGAATTIVTTEAS